MAASFPSDVTLVSPLIVDTSVCVPPHLVSYPRAGSSANANYRLSDLVIRSTAVSSSGDKLRFVTYSRAALLDDANVCPLIASSPALVDDVIVSCDWFKSCVDCQQSCAP